METVLWLSLGTFFAGFWVAMSKDDQIENGPKPAKSYEEMLQRINNYNRSIGAEEVQTLEVQYRKKNGL